MLLESTAAAATQEAAARRVNAEWYAGWFARLECHTIRPPGTGEPGWLRYPVLLDPASRAWVDAAPARRLGIAPGYPGALASLPAVRERMAPWSLGERSPGAERLVATLVTLPTHSLLTEEGRSSVLCAIAPALPLLGAADADTATGSE